MKKATKPFIITVSAISLVLLICITIFADKFFINTASDNSGNSENDGIPITFTLDSNTLFYDGSGKLNFMEGVHATDNKGNDITHLIKASIADSKTGKGKIISYSINKTGYEFSQTERALELSNYNKPSIKLEASSLSMDLSERDTYLKQIIADKIITADDGFGHDISSGIHSKDLSEIAESGEYTIKFSIENFLNDSAEISVPITVTGEIVNAEIILSTETVSIPTGSEFNPMDYVLTATDDNGNDLTHLINTDNPVDTSTPGQYTVTYSIKANDSFSSAVSLTVVVG